MALNWLKLSTQLYECLVNNSAVIGIESSNILLGDSGSIGNNSLVFDIFPNGLSDLAPEEMLLFKAQVDLYCYAQGSTVNETINNEMNHLINAILVLRENFPDIIINGITAVYPIASRNVNEINCVASCSIDYTVDNNEY